jgi:hypothetical protein
VQYTAPQATGGGWILFPVTGHLKLPGQETWWVLPPFFRLTQGEDHFKLYGPWPFLQHESGNKEQLYFWPLYGRKTMNGVDKRFFLWPLGQIEVIQTPTGEKTRTHLLPFYRRYVFEPVPELREEEPRDAWTKVWPLFSHHNRDDGQGVRTVIPDLNPMRDGPIERNFAPYWHWVVRERVDDRQDTEFLWGLYRSLDRGEDYRYRSVFPFVSWSEEEQGGHVSFLKGLFGWRTTGAKKQWQVLYLFRFGGKENADGNE